MEHQDDELHSLREQLRLHIDAAAKSAAAALQTAADLLLAMAKRESPVAPDAVRTETVSTPEVMTPEQAAEYLGVATQTLAVWRSTGRYALPFVKVGRHTRYRKADLDEFIRRYTFNRGREEDS
jgi:excisionase family DNA binding protein